MVDIKIYKKMDYFTIDIDISFEGGILVIQGESGAGKTTLLDCIAGLKNPDRGSISIEDRFLYSSEKNINLPVKDRNIGYLFQSYALFPHMSVMDNVLYGLKSRKIKDFSYAEKVLDSFGIHHIKDKLPSNISGGEKQRTALARAIATRPALLLLDEPFSALDRDTKASVYEEFVNFKENFHMDTILITHDEKEAKLLGDRIIHLKDGKVI
ncbi:ATP-binding cassette domain-containing protein [Lutispora saccharofermentans]|uniref:ATP-binding cassette domain-containing protein n=1 Tax=Lutispora saccharofermentans TaxID=3024236 RepID=A0ABT1ND59_9FIRM|nr:ATP-binding cassette domain-containing protein [Lutispora saccharofermentans]MCQ1529202.1 ATP-binding cassette domain-containing protein [Lutispora saccharofermentans]